MFSQYKPKKRQEYCGNVGSSASSDSDNSMVELPVWVNGFEKWISGLTSQTTCDDIIYALVAHVSHEAKDTDLESYRIFEKWGEVAKPLRGRTKLLKVWRTWGADSHKVKFILQKVNNYLDSSCELSNSRRIKMFSETKEKLHNKGINSLSKVKRQNSYRKSHIKNSDNYDKSHPIVSMRQSVYEKHNFEKLLHIVLSNEKKLNDQLEKINKSDREIEVHETRLHTVRAQKRGANYVQDAYLNDNLEQEGSSSGEELFPAIKANDLEAYLHMCNEILTLEDCLIEQTTQLTNLDKEMHLFTKNQAVDKAKHHDLDTQIIDEIQLLKNDISRSDSLCEAQHQQINMVSDTIQNCEHEIQRKNAFMQSLMGEVHSGGGFPVSFEDISLAHDKFTVPDLEENLKADIHLQNKEKMTKSGYSTQNKDASGKLFDVHDGVQFDLPYKKQIEPKNHTLASLSTELGRKDSGIVEDELCRTDIMYLINHIKNQSLTDNVQLNVSSDLKKQSLSEMNNDYLNDDHLKKHSILPFYVTRVSRDKNNYSDTESASDTGLSSMHSDDTMPCLETLV